MRDAVPLIAVLASPFVGSFLGVLTVRLPDARAIGWARSQCDHCGHTLGARDLVPILSWLWLRGRCRYCGGAIGWLAPAMEIAAIVIAVWAATVTSGWVLAATCGLGWTLLALSVIDWRAFLLPDSLTVPLAGAGLLVTYGVARDLLLDHVLAAGAGLLGTIALAFAYRHLRGREGLGLGDAKLLAALGAWLGLEGLPAVLLYGALLGLAYVLATALRGRPTALDDKIPLGTFLAAGGWLVWLYGPLVPG